MDKTVVELFAGVGGFHEGLSKADSQFRVIWANQWEPGKKTQYAFDCYKHHFGEVTECVNEDIATVKEAIPNHTLLVGGFPCQDYSVAATGAKGINGKKGVLWWEIRDIIQLHQPPFVLLENVDRLLKSPTKQRGRDFGIMLACFAELGYTVEWRVINAADYGMAQRRRRVFIFAYRETTHYANRIQGYNPVEIVNEEGIFAKAFPIKKETELRLTKIDYKDILKVSDEFHHLFKNSGLMRAGEVYDIHSTPVYEEPIPLKDILVDDAEERYFLGENLRNWEFMKGSKKLDRVSKTGHEYTFSEGAIPFPDPLDKPARTMLTSEASKNRSTHVISDPVKNGFRLLTPVECEKLNGFKPDWTKTMPHNFRYFVMGNALVVGIVERLGKQISGIIEKE